MALVLDSPVAADTLVHSGSCHFQCFPAGEDEGVLLADPVAGDLEDLAADAGGLGCMRKIDAVGAGEPAGPFLYPSPAALLHDVVRSSGEQRGVRLSEGYVFSGCFGHAVRPRSAMLAG